MHVSLEFLRRLVQTIFRIWDGQRRVYLGYYPGKLVQQLIAREGHEQETLTKFFSLAPAEWLATYWPEIGALFDLRAMALDPTGVYQHLLHKLEEAKEIYDRAEYGIDEDFDEEDDLDHDFDDGYDEY